MIVLFYTKIKDRLRVGATKAVGREEIGEINTCGEHGTESGRHAVEPGYLPLLERRGLRRGSFWWVAFRDTRQLILLSASNAPVIC